MQTKLHQWAAGDPGRRFDDLFNLVCDPAFLVVAWRTGAGQQGRAHRGRGPGRPAFIADRRRGGVPGRAAGGSEGPAVRPAAGAGADDPQARAGKFRRLGIPTARDRVVQAALKLVLEPIFEADFKPCQLRLPPEAARPGRDRRDPPPRLTQSELRVGVRGGHQGVLRRDRPLAPCWTGCGGGSGTSASWRWSRRS